MDLSNLSKLFVIELKNFCDSNSIDLDINDGQIDDQNVLKLFNCINKKNKRKENVNTDDSGDVAQLKQKLKDLKEELRLALSAAEDIKALKAKLMQMVERIRSEKETKTKIEESLKQSKKKVDILSDHMEKLMGHLKHEGAAKIRAIEQVRISEKKLHETNNKNILLTRKLNAKDKLINEFREGTKVLEDQLRLMDEKYLELRGKLDWARESGERRVKVAEKSAADLRLKFALSGQGGSLDRLPLPDIYSFNMNEGDTSTFGPMASIRSEGGGIRLDMNSKGSVKSKKSATEKIKTPQDADKEVDRILEKIRLKTGASAKWSEEKIRELTMSR